MYRFDRNIFLFNATYNWPCLNVLSINSKETNVVENVILALYEPYNQMLTLAEIESYK